MASTSSGDYEGSGDSTKSNNNNCDNEDGCGEGDLDGPQSSSTKVSILPTPSSFSIAEATTTQPVTEKPRRPTNAAERFINTSPTSQITQEISSTIRISSGSIKPSLATSFGSGTSSYLPSLPPIYKVSTTESLTKKPEIITKEYILSTQTDIPFPTSTTDESNSVDGEVFKLLTTANAGSTTVETTEQSGRPVTSDLLITSPPPEETATTHSVLVIPDMDTTKKPHTVTDQKTKTNKNIDISSSTATTISRSSTVETDINAIIDSTRGTTSEPGKPIVMTTSDTQSFSTETGLMTSEPIVVIGGEQHPSSTISMQPKTDDKKTVTELKTTSSGKPLDIITEEKLEKVNTPVVITDPYRTTLSDKTDLKTTQSLSSKPLIGTTLKPIINIKTFTKSSTNVRSETTRSRIDEEIIRTNAVKTKGSNNENEINFTVPTRDPNNRVQDPVIADVSTSKKSKGARLSINTIYILSVTCLSTILLGWLI